MKLTVPAGAYLLPFLWWPESALDKTAAKF
ncbi:MAG: hypothetical protein EWM73_01262 [Nitrospira sp.]|nr:MAG: hypothetical protein EWM73_01262 [Nitrospira sp.]